MVYVSAPKLMNTFPDKVGDSCIKPCSDRPGACPWCGTEGLCCKQNESINECDGTHIRPHISFKDTYPQWYDCEIIPGTGGQQRSAHRCILPPGKLSAYPKNAHLCINDRDQPKHFYRQCAYEK